MKTNYQKLTVWQKSVDLVEKIYKILNLFPRTETYSLVDQIKRSVVSISSNIAEWSQRSTRKDNTRFLFMAKGSAAELENQLIISKRLWFVSEVEFENIHQELIVVLQMLSSLIYYNINN